MNLSQFLSNQIEDGLGIREIARITGLSPSTISRIYHGEVSSGFNTTHKILSAFGYELVVKEDDALESGGNMSRGK